MKHALTIAQENILADLSNLATSKNYKVVFRNRTTNQGDFCFFIYKPGEHRYSVGFDGDWDSNTNTFEFCANQAKCWLKYYC